MTSQIDKHHDLYRTARQLTALLDMLACNPSGFRMLDDEAQESLLCLADNLSYEVMAGLDTSNASRICPVEGSSPDVRHV